MKNIFLFSFACILINVARGQNIVTIDFNGQYANTVTVPFDTKFTLNMCIFQIQIYLSGYMSSVTSTACR